MPDHGHVSPQPPDLPGYALPFLLFAGFRTIVDDLHAELARRGHPDLRPAYGFAMQAIGYRGATASELGRRLGVSKQAAGKTVDRLERLGYVERADDTADARRKLVQLTPRGIDMLTQSGEIFEDLRTKWAENLGERRLRDLEATLVAVAPDGGTRVDVAGWFGA